MPAVLVLILVSPASAARTRPIEAMKRRDTEHTNASIRQSAGRDAAPSLHIKGSAQPSSRQFPKQQPVVNESGEVLHNRSSFKLASTHHLANMNVLLPAKTNKTQASRNKTQAAAAAKIQASIVGPARTPAPGPAPGPAAEPAPYPAPYPAPGTAQNVTAEPAPKPEKEYLPIGEGADQSAEAVAQRTTDRRKHCEEGKWEDCYKKDGDYSDVHAVSEAKRKGSGVPDAKGGLPTFRNPYSGGMPSAPSFASSAVILAVLLVASW